MLDNLTVIIPFFEGHAYIDHLLADLPAGLPVIIVDDQSATPLTQPSRANTTLIRPARKGYFTGAVNVGIAACETDVLVLNQDVRLAGDGWLTLIADNRARYALIGERIQGNHPAFPHGYVHGVFQFMRRDAIQAAGLMDEVHYPLWGASALWQWQITRRGFHALPVAEIPGLTHQRVGNYGSSIRKLLNQEPHLRDKLIRTPPAISVVIPAYNHGRFLTDAVNSLIGGPTCLGEHPGQTFQSFEIIIVDDGSTDNTPEVAKQWSDWQGIHYIRQENQGTPAANNTGIKRAVGKYIVMMSADDMREPWSLSDLYNAAVANPGKIIYDEPTLIIRNQRDRLWPLANYDFDALLDKNMMHMGICFERAAWANVGGYPERMKFGREDWAFNIRMGQHGYCGLKIERSGYLYRRHDDNRTLINTNPEWRQSFMAQLRGLFPIEYRGERMPGCCGKASSSTPQAAPRGASRSALPAAPSGDMIMLSYEGGNFGSNTWGGPGATPSGRTYRFGRNQQHRIKFVERGDVQWFLAQRENGKNIFAIYTPAPEPEAAPIEDLAAAGEAIADGIASGIVQQHSDIDPATMTVAQIKALDLTPAQWQLLALMERNGKVRVSVLEYADAQVG